MLVVDCESSYNFILGEASQWPGRATPRKTKPRCPSRGVCAITTGGNKAATEKPDDPREGSVIAQGKPNGEVESVVLFGNQPDNVIKIGTGLSGLFREALIELLRKNASIFAWSYADMSGIPTTVISQKLGIDPAH
ncbi:hypothetical protein M0R45_031948 [Rubus argutus]|uniref:Reverse transcriptase domain-containing protein n=1 Tax=Rubus argutus TaxID=59490 RepID=A0AAW1WFT4_RUBAR